MRKHTLHFMRARPDETLEKSHVNRIRRSMIREDKPPESLGVHDGLGADAKVPSRVLAAFSAHTAKWCIRRQG